MFAKREKASLLTGSVFAEGNIVGIGMGILVGTLLGVAVACSVEKIKERKNILLNMLRCLKVLTLLSIILQCVLNVKN